MKNPLPSAMEHPRLGFMADDTSRNENAQNEQRIEDVFPLPAQKRVHDAVGLMFIHAMSRFIENRGESQYLATMQLKDAEGVERPTGLDGLQIAVLFAFGIDADELAEAMGGDKSKVIAYMEEAKPAPVQGGPKGQA